MLFYFYYLKYDYVYNNTDLYKIYKVKYFFNMWEKA